MIAVFRRGIEVAGQDTAHGNECPVQKFVMMTGGVVPGVTQVAVAVFEKPCETPLHRHPTMWEIYFFLEGKAMYTVGDQKFEVEPGDFLAVPPNTMHNQKVTEVPHKLYYFGLAIEDSPK